MKKRVISWLLCLALCLSMLPMAALAEDVQAPEGPAPSLNEPQPEPRAKENETPAPEPEKKVQSELMTAEKLLMPLSLDESSLPFTVGKILAEQDSEDIGTDGVEMSRNVQSGNTQNLKSTVIQRSFPKWSVAERRKTAAASDQAAVCACAHSRYFAGGSPSGLRV